MLINLRQVKPDDAINGTEPKILNFHAGWDYRIYASHHGAKIYVRLPISRNSAGSEVPATVTT
jgi:hypothetical protein